MATHSFEIGLLAREAAIRRTSQAEVASDVVALRIKLVRAKTLRDDLTMTSLCDEALPVFAPILKFETYISLSFSAQLVLTSTRQFV